MRIEENKFEDEISNFENVIKDEEYKIKLLKVKLKEKQQESSLCSLKIKELGRKIWFHSLKPLNKDNKSIHEKQLQPLTV